MQETQEQTIDLRGIINIIRKRLGLRAPLKTYEKRCPL